MEPQDNKKIALQKAILAHEQAEAALADLMKDGVDPAYQAMLEHIQANMAQLRADAHVTDPAEQV